MIVVGPELSQVGMSSNLGRGTLENRALGISEELSLRWDGGSITQEIKRYLFQT